MSQLESKYFDAQNLTLQFKEAAKEFYERTGDYRVSLYAFDIYEDVAEYLISGSLPFRDGFLPKVREEYLLDTLYTKIDETIEDLNYLSEGESNEKIREITEELGRVNALVYLREEEVDIGNVEYVPKRSDVKEALIDYLKEVKEVYETANSIYLYIISNIELKEPTKNALENIMKEVIDYSLKTVEIGGAMHVAYAAMKSKER